MFRRNELDYRTTETKLFVALQHRFYWDVLKFLTAIAYPAFRIYGYVNPQIGGVALESWLFFPSAGDHRCWRARRVLPTQEHPRVPLGHPSEGRVRGLSTREAKGPAEVIGSCGRPSAHGRERPVCLHQPVGGAPSVGG